MLLAPIGNPEPKGLHPSGHLQFSSHCGTQTEKTQFAIGVKKNTRTALEVFKMITGEMKNKVASAHDIPSKCCYFIDKAGSSLRRSRLKIILLYLHHNSAFTQNLGLTRYPTRRFRACGQPVSYPALNSCPQGARRTALLPHLQNEVSQPHSYLTPGSFDIKSPL